MTVGSTAMRNHRMIHTGVRPWACSRCPKRFRIRSDLRTHLRLKHPTYLTVIEIKGADPTEEEILRHLRLNNIPLEKVIDISKITVKKGTEHIVPNSARALSLMGLPRVPVAIRLPTREQIVEEFQPIRRGRGIAKNPRRPKILQHESGNIPQDGDVYPIELSAGGEEPTDINLQLLERDGVMVDGNQMVQLQLNDHMLQ